MKKKHIWIHRNTESFGSEGTFRDTVQHSCCAQGHLSTRSALLNRIFQASRNRRFTRCTGTIPQGFILPVKMFRCVQSEFPTLWFATTVSCYTVWHHQEQFAFRLLEVLIYFPPTLQSGCHQLPPLPPPQTLKHR